MDDNKNVTEKQAVQNLYNKIEEYKNNGTKLGLDEVKELIALYDACGVAFKKSYDLNKINKKETSFSDFSFYIKCFNTKINLMLFYTKRMTLLLNH